MRISDWSSDVCSSDLKEAFARLKHGTERNVLPRSIEPLENLKHGLPPWRRKAFQLNRKIDARHSRKGGVGRRAAHRSFALRPLPCPAPFVSARHLPTQRTGSPVLFDWRRQSEHTNSTEYR